MTRAEIHEKLKARFPDAVGEFKDVPADAYTVVSAPGVRDVATFLRDDPEMKMNALMCLSGVDLGKDLLGVVYHLESRVHRHKVTLKVEVPRESAKVASVALVWRTADWHEREAYDMVGIVFEGHPDLRRILCPDDWEGWPLRKDYKVQEWYGDLRVPYQDSEQEIHGGTTIPPGPPR
jgi:NADH-quinone oxidoreductase subunit C